MSWWNKINNKPSQKEGKIELSLGNGSSHIDPNDETIKRELKSLAAEDSTFAILSKLSDGTGLTYIQTSICDNEGGFIIEYQDGSSDKHFRASELVSNDKVIEAFLSYAKQDNHWKQMFNWERVNTGEPCFPPPEYIEEAVVRGDIIEATLTSEGKKKYLKMKYGSSGVEEIVLSNEMGRHTKIEVLQVLHNYSIEEAKELVDTAEKEVQKMKLDDIKRKIISKAKELYGNLPSDDDRKPIPDEVKEFVWRRDQGKCVKCGSQEDLEFDHIIPVSKGGSNTARNIQILCEKCNREKRDKI